MRWRNWNTLWLIFLLAVLTCPLPSAFAAPKVDVEPSFGAAGDNFLLTITIPNEKANDLQSPRFEATDEFRISGPSTASRMEWINGDQHYEIIFSFSVTPNPHLQPGKYKLPDGTVNIRGTEVRFLGPTIEITAAENKGESAGSGLGINFTHIVNNTTPYVGQQVLYRAELASKQPIRVASLSEIEPKGFLRESFGDQRQQQHRVGGMNRISVLEALFPTKPGTLTVPERVLHMDIEIPRKQSSRPNWRSGFGNPYGAQDPFAQFDELFDDRFNPFRREIVKKDFVAAAFPIEVRPLPDPISYGVTSVPTDYIPVGTLKVDGNIDKQEIDVGDTVTLTLTMHGDANLRPYELSKSALASNLDFKIYPAKPELEVEPARTGIRFTKKFVVSYVPQRSGSFTLPDVKILWFDPSDEKYHLYRFAEKQIKVHGQKGISGKQALEIIDNLERTQNDSTVPTEVPEAENSPAPQMSSLSGGLMNNALPRGFMIAFVALPPLGFFGFLLQQFLSRRRNSRQGKIRFLLRQMSRAKTLSEFSRAFLDFIGQIFDDTSQSIHSGALTTGEAKKLLMDKLSDRSLTGEADSLLTQIEKALYSQSNDELQSKDLVARGTEIAKKLQRIVAISLALFLTSSICFLPQGVMAAEMLKSETPEELLQKGNNSFAQGDYEQARQFYSAALRLLPENAALEYNLGNAAWKQKQVGLALGHFQNAIRLAPRNNLVRKNFQLLLAELSPPTRTELIEVYEKVHFPQSASLTELKWLILLAWCFCWASLFLAVSRRSRLSSFCFILSLLGMGLGAWQYQITAQVLASLPTLVTQPATKAYSAPDDTSQVIALLDEASVVSLQEQNEDWYRALLRDGRSAWIDKHSLFLPSENSK